MKPKQTMTVEEIREYLRHLSAAAGSQAELARRWNLTQGYINDVINGKEVPGPRILDRIGYAANVTVKYVRKVRE